MLFQWKHIKQMESKTCTICKIEKDINNFYKRYTECKDCNRTR